MPIKRKPKKEPKYHDSPPPSPSQDPNPPSPRKLRYLKAMKEMTESYTCHICKSLILIAFSNCETHTTVCSFCRLPCCSEPTSMIQIFCRKGLHDTYIRRCFSAAKNTDLEKSVRDEHEKQVEVINKWIKEERLKGYGVQAIDSEEEADPEDYFGVLGDVKTEVKTEKLEKEEKKVEIEGRIVRQIIKAEELGMVEGEENEEMKDSDEEMQQEIEKEMHHMGEDKIDEGRKKNQESEKEKVPREESPDTQREGRYVKIPNPKDSQMESQASKNKLSDTSNPNKTLHKKPSLEHDKARESSQKLLQNKKESKPLLQKQKLDTSKEISNPKPKESTKPPQNPTNNPKPEQISHQEKPKDSTKPQNSRKPPQKKESSKKKFQESSLVAQKQKATTKEVPKETPKISKTSQIHPKTTERVPQEQKDSGATLSKDELRDKLLKDCQLDEDIEEETKASNKGGKSKPLPVEEVKEISKRKKKEQEELANKLYQESVDSINKGSVKPLPKPVKKIPATESKPPQPQKLATSQSPDLSKKQDVEMESEQPTEPTELSPDPFQRAIDKDIKRIRDILDPFIQKIPEDMEVDEAIEIFRDCHKVSSLAIDTVRLFLEMRKNPEDISISKKEIEDVRIELGNLADINYEKVIKGVKAKYQEIKFTVRRIAIPDSCEKDYYITEVSNKSDAGDQNYKAKLIFSVTEYTKEELSKMSIQTTKIPSLKSSITTRSKLQKACNIHLQVHRKCLASCYSHLHINLRLNSVPLRYKLRTFTAPGTSTITLGISNLIPKSLLHNLNSPTSLTISLSFYTSSPCTSRLRSSSISTSSSASCLTTARAEPAQLAQKAVQVMLEEEVMKKRLEEKEQRVKDLEEQVRILKGIMEDEKKMREKENEERRMKVKKRMEERREKKDKESGKKEKRNVEDEEEDQGKESKEESLEEEKKKGKSEKEENFKKIAGQEDKQKENSEQESKPKKSSLVKKKAKEPSKTKKKLKKDSSQNAKPRRSPDKKKRERKLKEKSANKSKEINKRDKSKSIKKKAEKESKHSEIKKIEAPVDTVSTPRFPNSSRESRKLKRNKRSSPANTPTPKSSESISQPKVGKKSKSSQKRNTSKLRKNKKETQKSYRRQKPSPPRKHYSRKYAKKDSKSRYSKSPTPSKGKSSKSNTQIPSSSRPRKSYGYFGFSGNNHKSQNEDPQNISIPEHDSDADIQSPDNSPKNSPPAKLRRSRRPKPWAEEASMTPTSPKEEPKRKPRKKSKGKSKPKAKAKDKSKKKSKKNKKSRKKD